MKTPQSKLNNNRWWILFVTTSASALVFLDNTVMPVALPTIQRELGFSSVGAMWTVNAYLLSLISLLLIGGRLSDLFGLPKLYRLGLVLFGIGSILGGVSMTKWMLIMGRAVQGAGGACMTPTISALLVQTFPPQSRAKAIGINVGISSLFLILGPAIGGFFTQYLDWRGIFWINIPIVIFGLWMSYLILEPDEGKKEPFHALGAFSVFVGMTALVVGLMQGDLWGWSNPLTLALIIIGPLLLVFFIFLSLREYHPLIDLSVFRDKGFTAAILAPFLTQVSITASIFWAIYFQKQLDFSPVFAGMIIFIATLPVILMAPLSGYLADKYGARRPIIGGFVLILFAMLWVTFTVNTKNIPLYLPGLLAYGAGIPMILSPATALCLSLVSSKRLGSVSAITMSSRLFASTLGLALMTAIFQAAISKSGSYVYGFYVINVFAGVVAVGGLFLAIFGIRNLQLGHKPDSHKH